MTSRRHFLRLISAGGGAAVFPRPSFARGAVLPPPRREWDLVIGEEKLSIAGRRASALTINGTMPGPLLHWREGQEVVLRVRNTLREDTSIHWHGILLPYQMDGVPGVSFGGIPPGETFEYRFPVLQHGTYWYHSHSGFQEQRGLVGPIVVSPKEGSPHRVDRDYTLVLTDWTFMRPERVMAILKKQVSYFNYQRRTVTDAVTGRDGMSMKHTLMWGRMRMEPTDIADVTGSRYEFLLNGRSNDDGWTGLFTRGDRVRLRIINASAMTHFDLRIADLPMTVIAADGQPVRPVEIDELRVAVAETYDVLVEPGPASAYSIFAEPMDRSGYVVGTLATAEGLRAPIPERRKRPLLTMADMGMAPGPMSNMDHGGPAQEGASVRNTDRGGNRNEDPQTDGDVHGEAGNGGDHARDPSAGSVGMDHGGMASQHLTDRAEDLSMAPPLDLSGLTPPKHGPDRHGVLNLSVTSQPRVLVNQPGPGLRDAPHRVLVYSDLVAPTPYSTRSDPDRELELHLTGHMERYVWSINGRTFAQEPFLHLRRGELVRLIFVNDTMMSHPMHLHGMWMELENGRGDLRPRKHTIDVRPGERITALVTVDAPGDWAFHCHLQYHMDQGMFRIVRVTDTDHDEVNP